VQAMSDVHDLEAIWRTHAGSLHAGVSFLVDRIIDRAHNPGESADQIVLRPSSAGAACG
jgi:hypothetical protein